MRTVNPHLLENKMDDAVTHYINSHQQNETVHVDNGLPLNVLDDGAGRVVTVMHPQSFPPTLSRQVSVGDTVAPECSAWGDDLVEVEGRLAAIVAHLAQHSHTNHQVPHHKVTQTHRSEEEPPVMLDVPMRLFNGQTLDHHQEQDIEVPVPSLPPLLPLPELKRCSDNEWFTEKHSKNDVKENQNMLADDARLLGMPVGSPGYFLRKLQKQKSLPHKKRISKKLKRSPGNSTPQQFIVEIDCADAGQEEILPDNYVQHPSLQDGTHQITQEFRPLYICQICGDFYGEEQLKFYHHLKQHYESHATIIIENPVSDLGIDKMTNTCIVDNVSVLPDSFVELSLDSLPTSKSNIYQPMKEHALYSSSDNNKMLYSVANIEKDDDIATEEPSKDDVMYQSELYGCNKCKFTFRKQKHFEAHMKEIHSKHMEESDEFSEPEDLMEGIHVSVSEEGAATTDQYTETLLPHLCVDNGHVHQEHVRQWYSRNGGSPQYDEDFCPVCPQQMHPHRDHTDSEELKQNVIHTILEEEVHTTEEPAFTSNIIKEDSIPDNIQEDIQEGIPDDIQDTQDMSQTNIDDRSEEDTEKVEGNGIRVLQKKGNMKKYECIECSRIFNHKSSVLYHLLLHKGKRTHVCQECGKGFYTSNALKIHNRTHNDIRPHKCEFCERTFRQWGDLKYHISSLHSEQKNYKCEYCNKEFARKYSLNVHIRIHTGERNYKCPFCSKSFRASSYRLSHIRTHTGERPHKCTLCDKSFRVGGDLRRHMIVHNRIPDKKLKIKLENNIKDEVNTITVNTEILEPEKAKNHPESIKATQIGKKRNPRKTNATTDKLTKSPVKKSTRRTPKKSDVKIGNPNVTVSDDIKPNIDAEKRLYHLKPQHYQILPHKEHHSKFKELHSHTSPPQHPNEDQCNKFKPTFNEHCKTYLDNDKPISERELTHLRTLNREIINDIEQNGNIITLLQRDNTDGKNITIYLEKPREYSVGGTELSGAFK